MPLLVIAVVLSLTACASSDGSRAEPSSSPSASETPAPTPTPTPTAMDPADPSTWTITTAGIGPSQLGDLDDEAIVASLAPAFVAGMRCEGLTAFDPADPGSPLSMYTAVSGLSTPEHPGFFRAVGVSAPDAARIGEVEASPQTESGIGLGSTLSDLEAAYPALEPWEDPRGTTPGFTDHALTDSAGSLLFTVADDRVVSITATFDLPPVGYCS